jgi:hypothetical protein
VQGCSVNVLVWCSMIEEIYSIESFEIHIHCSAVRGLGVRWVMNGMNAYHL